MSATWTNSAIGHWRFSAPHRHRCKAASVGGLVISGRPPLCLPHENLHVALQVLISSRPKVLSYFRGFCPNLILRLSNFTGQIWEPDKPLAVMWLHKPSRGQMSPKFEECQQRAAEFLRLAQAVADPKNKAALLDMAQAWIRLAEQIKAKG